MASSTGSLNPPLPSPLAQSPSFPNEASDEKSEDVVATNASNPLDSVPPLTTAPATTEDDRVEALHLLADSVAQQRQVAATAAMFHPLTVSTLVLGLGLVYQYLYHGSASDLALVGTTTAGVLMALLISIRWLTGGYIEEAERIGTWKWLNLGRDDPNSTIVGEEDEILITRFGDEAIGTILVRGIRELPGNSSTGSAGGNSSPRKPRTKNLPVTARIRGWTVKRRYRHKGIGTGLLEEALTLTQSKGWQGLEFADDHANSAKLLPATFSGGFVKRERLGREALERVKEEKNGVDSANGKGGRKSKR